jgi:hypothetical protein
MWCVALCLRFCVWLRDPLTIEPARASHEEKERSKDLAAEVNFPVLSFSFCYDGQFLR